MNGRIKRETPLESLSEIGKIKIGEKVIGTGGKKDSCRSLDHFIATGKYAGLFTKAYPKEVSVLPILFISDDPLFSCNERMELRDDKGKLYSFGDGENFKVYNKDAKEYQLLSVKDYPKLIQATQERTGTEYHRVLTLRFVVLAIRGVMGVWSFQTKADKSSIDKIVGAFDMIQQRVGTVKRILFDLVVDKAKSQAPDSKSVYPVISLIPNVSDGNLKILKEYTASGELLSDEKLVELEAHKQLQLTQGR